MASANLSSSSDSFIEDIYPLSPIQKGLLFHNRLTPESDAYFRQAVYEIEGALNLPVFERAWKRTIWRHALLRTAFFWEEVDTPVQVVCSDVMLPLVVEDFRNVEEPDHEAAVQQYVDTDRKKGFNLGEAPLLRLALLRVEDEHYYFVFTFHHLLLDGWSNALVLKEVKAYYDAYLVGKELKLPEPRPYRDYLNWLEEQDPGKAEAWWRERMRGFTTPTPLPMAENSRSVVVEAVEHQREELRLSREESEALQHLARQQQVTLNTLVQAAWGLLLSRHSGKRDVVFGVTVSGRNPHLAGMGSMVGLFINTLPVRMKFHAAESTGAWLKRMQREQAEAYAYEYTPLVEAQNWSEVERGTPLFESLYAFENFSEDSFEERYGGKLENTVRYEVSLRARPDRSFYAVNYPLALLVVPAEQLHMRIMFHTGRFRQGAAEQMLAQLRMILMSIVADTRQSVSAVRWMSEAERCQVLEEWNRTEKEIPGLCVYELFEEQAARTPHAIALEYEGQTLTYGELNRRANQMGHYLRKLGVGPEVRVGICVERSLEMVISLLGILKAGGAYVPLDPDYPPERLQFMVEDAQVAVLLTEKKFLDLLWKSGVLEICLEEQWDEIAEESEAEVGVQLDSHHLAYVIYTSGSTGNPKGVGVEHRSIVRLVKGVNYVEVKEDDIFLQMAPVSFDAATFEIWGSLLNGCRLVIYPAGIPSLEQLGGVAERSGVTVLWLTASLFHQMVDTQVDRLQGIRQLLAGGDVLSIVHVGRALAELGETSLINGYGPTENTTFSCCHRMRGEDGSELGATVPIGRPITNSQAYVLDEQMRYEPMPVGGVGELYVGGVGLARGYMNRPELTAEKFVPNPFNENGAERLYRTGDRARWRADGSLEFLGRLDHQVKLRGFRIELGEIEAVLRGMAGVKDTAVVVREEAEGDKRLVAYIVMDRKVEQKQADDGGEIREKRREKGKRGRRAAEQEVEWRRYVGEKLPDYMVPSHFVVLDGLPLTANGKLDRKALPAPVLNAAGTAEEQASASPVEQIVAAMYEEVLGVEKVGVEANFFELGGHSLLATQVISRVRKVFDMELALRVLFENPTVRELGKEIEKQLQMAREAGEVTIGVDEIAIEAVQGWGKAPLSYAQQRLWFIDRLEPAGSLYNIPFALRLRGKLDHEALKKSLKEIVRRHEVLRTHFVEEEGEPVQVIVEDQRLELEVVDLGKEGEGAEGGDGERGGREGRAGEREQRARRMAGEEAQMPFDLSRGPLLRTKLLRLGAEDHVLLVTMHHIVSDGWSFGILVREFSALYEAHVTGLEAELPELGIQYADFAVWQRKWLQGEVLERQMRYWRGQLQGLEPLEVPADYPRPAVMSHRGATVEIDLGKELTRQIRELCRSEGVTLFMALLGAVQVLLGRYAGQQDVAVGTPIANRTRREIEPLIGFFVNTLVLRGEVRSEWSFRALLKRVREVTLGAYAHQDVPFEHLVEELQPVRDLSRNPLFEVMLVVQNAPQESFSLPGLSVDALSTEGGDVAKFDLTFSAAESANKIRVGINYATELYEQATMERMARHFRAVLEEMTRNADSRIGEITILSEAERTQLEGWNQTERDYAQRCVHELFEEQVARTPEALAVECEGRQLTYGELNRRANQLGHYLRKQGVGPEWRVGICAERSLEMMVGLLGILKAGGGYVPLDPSYPIERLRYMVEDSRPMVLLTQGAGVKLGSRITEAIPVVGLDEPVWEEQAEENPDPRQVGLSTENLAYVIYTSGTTGRPKGVMVEHRQVLNQLLWSGEALSLAQGDRVLQKASYSFDASILEIFLPLAYGAGIVVAEPGRQSDVDYLIRLAIEKKVTYIDLSPSLLAALLDHPMIHLCTSLRLVTSGTEALKPELVASFHCALPTAALWNEYGPTEATVQSTFAICTEAAGNPPIGKPIANTQVYAVDAWMNPVPVGVPGELYIGGAGVTRGYCQDAGLTAAKFVPDSFGSEAGGRLYSTGDRVRWRGDGNLEYLGRLDQQVKIRGYRIELGEIEAALQEQAGVSQAVVVMQEDGRGDKRLVAYVVGEVKVDGSGQVELDGSELRRHLREHLPEYMVPSTYVQIEELPLNANGKLDRKRLPQPEAVEAGEQDRKPRTAEEEILCGIWEQVLRVERVGVEQNFFEIGGHSLLATQVISRIREAFGVEIPLRILFERPTVAGLAEEVKHARMQEGGRTVTPLVRVENHGELPLSFAQQRLWFMEQIEPGNAVYNMPFALRIRGELDREALIRSIWRIVERHEVLRTVFEWNREQEPVQRVLSVEEAGVVVEEIELRELGAEQREAEARRLAGVEAGKGFNLGTGPVLRVKLLEMKEQEHVLLVTMHHIASDGWSFGILVREFMELYGAEREQREAALEELPIQYGDYATWQRKWLGGGELQEQMGYWKEQLAGLETLEVPTDHPRPGVMSHGGAMVEMGLGEELTKRIRELCRREGVTLFMVLLGAVQVLLGRYAGQQEVVVGTPIANRTRREIEPLIGFFVNTLVLRGEVRREWSFREMLKRVREVTLGAYAHQDVPFEHLVEELQPVRDLSRNPLFDVMLVVQNTPQESFSLPGLSVETLDTKGGEVAKFDLTFSATERANNIEIGINYATELYEQGTIERMARHFRAVVEEMTRNADSRIGEITILSDAERGQLEEWNRTETEYPKVCLHELFEEQAHETPHVAAVVFGDRQLSYRELDDKANRLARHLRSLGVGPDVCVGICMERCLEMIVGVLGVLKAGGAYVPLDPSYPGERLAFMLHDSSILILLTQKSLATALPLHDVRTLYLDCELQEEIGVDSTNHDNEPHSFEQVTPEHLAYVIYTSGSTGKPKGVAMPHRPLVNLFVWQRDSLGLLRRPRTLQFSPLSFDVSANEAFATWAMGGTLVLISEEQRRDPAALVEFLDQQQIDSVYLPFIALQQIADECQRTGRYPVRLREVVSTAEPLQITRNVARFFSELPSCRLYNEYGPSETHVVSSWMAGRSIEEWPAWPPIGRPIANTQLYIVDQEFYPTPVGVPGSLYIGGDNVARGYVGRPELTAQRFIPDPFSRTPGARLYDTGDLAVYLPDANIRFLGRADQQVKLRGHRIELGEIESALDEHPGVQQSAVVMQQDASGERQLTAFILIKEGSDISWEQLRPYLQQKLPDYMVPAAGTFIATLPMTPSGKVDRKKLRETALVRSKGAAEPLAPRNPAEKLVAEIWAEVLHRSDIGVKTNFFEIGGHSLQATQIIARIRMAFQIEGFPLRRIFQTPTIAGLVQGVEEAVGGESVAQTIAGTVLEIRALSPEQVEAMLSSNQSSE